MVHTILDTSTRASLQLTVFFHCLSSQWSLFERAIIIRSVNSLWNKFNCVHWRQCRRFKFPAIPNFMHYVGGRFIWTPGDQSAFTSKTWNLSYVITNLGEVFTCNLLTFYLVINIEHTCIKVYSQRFFVRTAQLWYRSPCLCMTYFKKHVKKVLNSDKSSLFSYNSAAEFLFLFLINEIQSVTYALTLFMAQAVLGMKSWNLCNKKWNTIKEIFGDLKTILWKFWKVQIALENVQYMQCIIYTSHSK